MVGRSRIRSRCWCVAKEFETDLLRLEARIVVIASEAKKMRMEEDMGSVIGELFQVDSCRCRRGVISLAVSRL